MSIALKVRKILSDIINVATSSQTLQKVGESAKGAIYDRTLSGNQAKEDGKVVKLPELRASTKSIRRNLKARGKLSSKTTPGTSNLTRTGKMLDGMRVKPKKNKVDIELTPAQKRKAADLSDKFNFMSLSSKDIDVIVDLIEKEIEKKIK